MTWVNVVVQGILLGGLYALFATGLSLMFGVMRLVNLAHGDLSIVAAFLALAIVSGVDINPLWILFVVVPLMAGVGYLLQRGLLNFALRGDDPLPPVLVTFGLSIILQNLLLEVFSADSQGLDAGRLENASIRVSDRLAVGWFPLLTLVTAVSVLVGLATVERPWGNAAPSKPPRHPPRTASAAAGHRAARAAPPPARAPSAPDRARAARRTGRA